VRRCEVFLLVSQHLLNVDKVVCPNALSVKRDGLNFLVTQGLYKLFSRLDMGMIKILVE
jgi:hypothetical protein